MVRGNFLCVFNLFYILPSSLVFMLSRLIYDNSCECFANNLIKTLLRLEINVYVAVCVCVCGSSSSSSSNVIVNHTK